jgi:hypothetical protein
VLGTAETETRERPKREVALKLSNSLGWQCKENKKRERKSMGPTSFFDLSIIEKKEERMSIIILFPILSFSFNLIIFK